MVFLMPFLVGIIVKGSTLKTAHTRLSLLIQCGHFCVQCCHADLITASLNSIIYTPYITPTHVNHSLTGIGDSVCKVCGLVAGMVVVRPRQSTEVGEQ